MEPFTDPRNDLVEAIDAGGSQQARARLLAHRALEKLTESPPTRMPAEVSCRNLMAWLMLGLVRFPGATRSTSTRASYWQAASAQLVRGRRAGLLASDAVSKLAAEHLCHWLDFPNLGRRDEEQIEWLHRVVASLDLRRLRKPQQNRLEVALDELGYLPETFDFDLASLLDARQRAAHDFDRFFTRVLDTVEAHTT